MHLLSDIDSMKFATVRSYALALPEVTEEPHHNFGSFRVRGKIFLTFPPGQEYVHIFVSEQLREEAPAMYPEFIERLFWGGKVAGIKVTLNAAAASVVKVLLRQAWENKAPQPLIQA